VDIQTISDAATTPQPAGDGRRYVLVCPRGIDPLLDNQRPGADHHAITVYGSADLARRVAEAHRLGVCVAWQRLDDDRSATDDSADGW
jgi:hypothetical protein